MDANASGSLLCQSDTNLVQDPEQASNLEPIHSRIRMWRRIDELPYYGIYLIPRPARTADLRSKQVVERGTPPPPLPARGPLPEAPRCAPDSGLTSAAAVVAVVLRHRPDLERDISVTGLPAGFFR